MNETVAILLFPIDDLSVRPSVPFFGSGVTTKVSPTFTDFCSPPFPLTITMKGDHVRTCEAVKSK